MKILSLISLVQLLMATISNLQTPETDRVIGIWQSERKDSKVEIYKSGGKYYGKLLAGWGNKIYQADGKTLTKDEKNPDVNLRNHTLLNTTILSDLTYHDGEYTGGKLYDARSGKSYNCQMKVKDGKLKIRGYWKFYALGMTTNWTRLN
ncbi:DUF2147 domain-containing protein [Mucilaginibacter sp. UYCu711]|uniref:DUF2147 domain-containing protein n=1 Tax=Mucilaginibacter sp. UYCu711 TaxID=3156339 RepID=UPI003D20580C